MCRFSRPCTKRCPPRLPLVAWDGRAVGHKAALLSGDTTIYIEKSHWDSLDPVQRVALLCRMSGYANGAECEPCADAFADSTIQRELEALTSFSQRSP